jgi:pantoate--beta-alanine ligase
VRVGLVIFQMTAAWLRTMLGGVKVIRSVKEMQEAASYAHQQGRRVALVPTMGALHEGHAALMRKARERGAAVIVSIYVNPTQFGPREDFRRYPRTLDADLALCARESVEAVFVPPDEEVYASGDVYQVTSTWVEETTVARRHEGERRPGHFRGVCTVVAKLFNIVRPEVAVFGLKDYQQFKVIRRMVRDLCYPIEVVGVPTLRESDGLALSSRNKYLSTEERAQALVLWKALNVALDLFNSGEINSHRLEAAIGRTIQLAPSARLDYADIVNADTLEPVTEARRGDVILLAVNVGTTRLIDNLTL